MSRKFTSCFTLLLLLVVCFLKAKDLNLDSLDKEITRYNREGKQALSQKKLSALLFSGDLTKEEEATVLYYMAVTYRGVCDYRMCIDYLNKASDIAEDFPKDNILQMKLDYEYAFAYFDNKEYQKSNAVMEHIAVKKYSHVLPENQAYILLQEGYLFSMNKDYYHAEKKYGEALGIMKEANYCNLPVVYVKIMDLYSQKKNIQKAEYYFSESMKISQGCSILKYEIYATSQMEIIYKENNLLDKAYTVGLKVDSLRKLENLEARVSEMHLIDKKFLERQEILESKSVFWGKAGSGIAAVVFLSLIGYSFVKSRNLKSEKLQMKEEIAQMKDDLESYAENPHSDEKFVNTENAILDLEKLTERQKDLYILMADGLSNKEIAEKLFITESTVKYHIKNIYSVLQLKDRKDFFKKLKGN